MEAFDPVKNEESGGFSRRRPSSILKAPRKSIRISEAEQQDNVVEYTKPVEKRISRRVSFAPANDVLLFSKDVKNAQGPLQELITTSSMSAQNRVQMMVTEDGNQQITGMEDLLKAPIHALQPKDKASDYTREDFGEKTLMFNTGDAFMDMTHCHTINITNEEELLEDSSHYGILPTGGDKTMMFTADGSMDMTLSQTVHLTCGQETFSLSKPSLPSVTLVNAVSANVDKENQAPKFINKINKKMGESLCVRSFCPEDDMDMTEAQTGRIMTNTAEDDPQQCLFLQEIYSQDDKRKPQTNPKGLETSLKSKMLKCQVNIDSEDQEKTVRFSADDACMDVTKSHTVKISTDFQLPSDLERLSASGEKTVRFNTNEAGMDMTQCLTVNISSDLVPSSAVKQKQESVKGSLSVQGMDLEFENFLASVSQGSVPNEKKTTTKVASSFTTLKTQSSVKTQGQPPTVLSMNNSRIESSKKDEMCQDDDEDEDTNIFYQNVYKTGMSSQQRRSELGSYSKKGIESSIMAPIQRHQVDFRAEDFSREKSVMFTAEEALMEGTRRHTVNIANDFDPEMQQNLDVLPVLGEKTVRFDVDDAAMDISQCHTVSIATDIEPPSHGSLVLLPKYGEKTVRFNANDATMDVTRSLTVNIDIDFEPQPHGNLNSLPTYGEKTVRFNANDAAMDVTQSNTVNIATDVEPRSCDNDLLPKFGDQNLRFGASGACMNVTQSSAVNIATDTEQQLDGDVREKTMRFNVKDANMEVTQCPTVNIGVDSEGPHSDLYSVPLGFNMDFPSAVKKREHSIFNVRRSRSSAAHSLKPALKSRRSVPWASSLINSTVPPTPAATEGDINVSPTLACSTGDINNDIDPIQTHKALLETENKGFVSAVHEKPENEVLQSEDCQVNDISMNMTEALTGHLLGQTLKEAPPQCSVKYLPPSAEEGSTEAVISNHEVEMKNESNSSQINENKDKNDENNEVEVSEKCSPASGEKHRDSTHSRKSRRMTLDDIQSKIRRLSQMLNAAPDNVVESCTTPLTDPGHSVDFDQTKSLPAAEPDLKIDQENSENQTEPFISTTPYKLETKQLMSRLSVVGFKPKLPRRSKAEETKQLDSSLGPAAGEPTKTLTIHIPNQLDDFSHDVSDINDEELGSYEDVSETLDTKSPEKGSDKLSSSNEFDLDPELHDEVFEEEFVSVNEKKRPLPEDESITEDEKRMKTSVLLSPQTYTLESDDNITTAPSIHMLTTDSSNCSHSLRCEATFESTSKQSLFESQLEDYASDIQRKFDDGTLTMREFFKLFHIDFVIHNPRQSVVPARVLTDTDCTLMDFSRDRHISFPKQLVYETDVRNLTEQVERLKVRMRDLDKPLRLVNRTLWEEMGHFSEAEFKSFGAKLKERHNLFRKMSKAQSHEMKEVLYSDLLQANEEEQKKLRGSIEEADAMIKSLDECIQELESDLAAVEEGVTSQQEGLDKITDALADNEKSTSELEIQKKQNLNKVKRVKEETKKLEKHITMLYTINEWKLGKRTNNCTVYTFLHETLHLELVFEESTENDERKIAEISFVKQLNDEKSQCHVRLVHSLVSQYTQGQSWVKKYPTSRHVPQLLHEVSLVVSQCRRFGEELRRLKMWGSLRFDILDISCLETEVHIVFSSLKTFSKFEVVFSVSLTSHLCVFQVKSFKNIIGNVTIQQIEEIVASFTPGNNYLTKIINKIHSSLLG